MSNAMPTVQTKNPFDIFIIGLRKGFNVAINNLPQCFNGFRIGLHLGFIRCYGLLRQGLRSRYGYL